MTAVAYSQSGPGATGSQIPSYSQGGPGTTGSQIPSGKTNLADDPFLSKAARSRSPSPSGSQRGPGTTGSQIPSGKTDVADDPFLSKAARSRSQSPSGKSDASGRSDVANDPFLTHSKPQQASGPQWGDYDVSNDIFMVHNNKRKHLVAPGLPEKPEDEIIEPPPIPYWYQCKNNWDDCLLQMRESYLDKTSEFTGREYKEFRIAKETGEEKLSNALFHGTGGTVGARYQYKTEELNLVDVFQDWDFPGENRSWLRQVGDSTVSTIVEPFAWARLCESTIDPPFFSMGTFTTRSGRPIQGALEDFYLVHALHIIGMKPQLVRDVFVNMQFSNARLGLWTIRLYKHCQWMHVTVDDALPVDRGGLPLCTSTEFYPEASWPCLIEKAYAKLHGSWEALSGGGHVEEALTDLTGGCSSRFSTCDAAPDRLWQYFAENAQVCLFGCHVNERNCAARGIPVRGFHAAAVFEVRKYKGVPYVSVSLAAQEWQVKFFPCHDVPSMEGYGISDGFAWLRMEDFVQLFDIIYECRLVNSPIPGCPYSPGWMPGSPWFEELWAYNQDVVADNCPTFLIAVSQVPVVITMEVSQTDLRYSERFYHPENSRPEEAPLLLRFFQSSPEIDENHGGEIYLAHMSAWGHCRDSMCVVKCWRPGKYIAMVSMPAKYVCNKMLFRTYSTFPIYIRPIEHDSFISIVPSEPLAVLPYSMVGMMKIDAVNERLPQMFDEDEGKGKPYVGWTIQKIEDAIDYITPEHWRSEHYQGYEVLGSFGGSGAVGTINAIEHRKMGECTIT